MLTPTTQEAACFAAPGQASRVRVQLEDGAGVMQDMGALLGRDWVMEGRLEEQADEDFARVTLVLREQQGQLNLSALRADSRLNLPSGVYKPFLFDRRRLVVEMCTLPVDGPEPTSGDWRVRFDGFTGPAMYDGDGTVRLEAWDAAHQLADADHFLEEERTYGSGAGVAVQTVMQQLIDDSYGHPWQANTPYALRDRVHKVSSNGYWYWCTDDGTSGGSEPTWPTSVGATVADGGVIWTCKGTIMSLWCPTAPSPSWLIAPAYAQKRMPCWQALQELVRQLGWALRYVWDSGTSAYRLKLYEPPRGKTTPDFTWYPETTDSGGADVPALLEIPSLMQDVASCRTVIEGQYSDVADLDAAGAPKRKTMVRRDVSAIDALAGLSAPSSGWKWMSLAVKAADQINTSAEMQRMLDNILADVKDPYATHEVLLPLFFPVELGDLYRFKANRRYSADQDVAVVGIVHEWGAGKAPTTRLTCRGKPSAGFQRWLQLDTRTAAKAPAAQAGPDQPTNVTLEQTQGGLAVTWDSPTSGRQPDAFEVHTSYSGSFTPSSSTIAAVVAATGPSGTGTYRKELGTLTPGSTVYVQVVPRYGDQRGTASAEVSLAAGYTPPRALTPQVVHVSLAPNPDFEALTDPASPPDTWVMATGTWGTDAIIDTSDVYGGARAVKCIANAVLTKLRSALFPCVAGVDVYAECFAKVDAPGDTAANPFMMELEFFSDLGVTSTGTATIGRSFISTGWELYGGVATAPSGTKYARLRLGKNETGAGGNWALHIDSTWISRTFGRGALEVVPFNGSGYGASIYASGFSDWGVAGVMDGRAVYNRLTGEVRLEGSFQANANKAAGTTALTIGSAPSDDISFVCLNNGAPALITLKASGALVIGFAYTTPQEIALPGLQYVVGR